VFENRVLRLKFGPEEEEVREGFMFSDLMEEDEMCRA
jgi:hypothetical protein